MTTAHYDDIVDLSDYGVPEEEEERFHVMMGPGEVKELSLEQLDDFFRLEVIDADTLVWQDGMSGWKPLREVAGLGDEDEQAEDEIWHVQMAPGEVKQLTLEQLDDFYRLGVIEDSTPVWQPGMDGWLPLSKVAGIEAEPASSAAPTAAAVAAATAPFDPFFDKPPVAQKPVAAPFDPFFDGPPVAPVASKPVVAPLPSTAPMALSFTPPPPQAARSSGAVRFLFGVAAVAGLLVTLHRNGVLFDLAGSLGEQGRYTSAEKETLGGPAFGTPRAVEELIASQRSERPNVDLSLLLPKPEPAATKSDGDERADDTAAAQPERSTDKTDKKAAEAEKPSAKSKSELEQRMAAALRGQPTKPAPRKATRSAPRAKKSSSDSVIPGNTRRAKGKASEYDPLNGQL